MKGSRPDQQQDRVNWLDASVVVHNPDKQVLKGLADRLRTEATGGTQSSLSAPEQRAILTTALKDLGVTVIDSEAVGAY